MTTQITSFRGENYRLSNMYISPFFWMGKEYKSAEHAYQASKTDNAEHHEWIRMASTPNLAKRIGRQVMLRENWKIVKYPLMYSIVSAKFSQNQEMREYLIETGDAELIEGNTWGDTYWGVCDGVGQNMLGKVLMQVRKQLRGL